MSSLLEKIRNADDIGRETITVDRWGVTFELRGLSGRDGKALLSAMVKEEDGSIIVSDLDTWLAKCICDPDTGEFFLNNPAGIDLLESKSIGVRQQLLMKIIELSGLDMAALDREKPPSSETSEGGSSSS